MAAMIADLEEYVANLDSALQRQEESLAGLEDRLDQLAALDRESAR